MVECHTPEKGRAGLFLRAFLLESQLCLVHLRRGDGGWWVQALAEHMVQIKAPFWFSYTSDLLACSLAGLPLRAGACLEQILCPPHPTQTQDERMGVAVQLFSRLFHGART